MRNSSCTRIIRIYAIVLSRLKCRGHGSVGDDRPQRRRRRHAIPVAYVPRVRGVCIRRARQGFRIGGDRTRNLRKAGPPYIPRRVWTSGCDTKSVFSCSRDCAGGRRFHTLARAFKLLKRHGDDSRALDSRPYGLLMISVYTWRPQKYTYIRSSHVRHVQFYRNGWIRTARKWWPPDPFISLHYYVRNEFAVRCAPV